MAERPSPMPLDLVEVGLGPAERCQLAGQEALRQLRPLAAAAPVLAQQTGEVELVEARLELPSPGDVLLAGHVRVGVFQSQLRDPGYDRESPPASLARDLVPRRRERRAAAGTGEVREIHGGRVGDHEVPSALERRPAASSPASGSWVVRTTMPSRRQCSATRGATAASSIALSAMSPAHRNARPSRLASIARWPGV